MEQLAKQELLTSVLISTKDFSLKEKIEFLSNLLLSLSLLELINDKEPLPSNWDEAFSFLVNKKKQLGESLAVALGLQAITMNMWLLTEKK